MLMAIFGQQAFVRLLMPESRFLRVILSVRLLMTECSKANSNVRPSNVRIKVGQFGKTQFVLFGRMQFVLKVCSMHEVIVCSTWYSLFYQIKQVMSVLFQNLGNRTNLTLQNKLNLQFAICSIFECSLFYKSLANPACRQLKNAHTNLQHANSLQIHCRTN